MGNGKRKAGRNIEAIFHEVERDFDREVFMEALEKGAGVSPDVAARYFTTYLAFSDAEDRLTELLGSVIRRETGDEDATRALGKAFEDLCSTYLALTDEPAALVVGSQDYEGDLLMAVHDEVVERFADTIQERVERRFDGLKMPPGTVTRASLDPDRPFKTMTDALAIAQRVAGVVDEDYQPSIEQFGWLVNRVKTAYDGAGITGSRLFIGDWLSASKTLASGESPIDETLLDEFELVAQKYAALGPKGAEILDLLTIPSDARPAALDGILAAKDRWLPPRPNKLLRELLRGTEPEYRQDLWSLLLAEPASIQAYDALHRNGVSPTSFSEFLLDPDRQNGGTDAEHVVLQVTKDPRFTNNAKFVIERKADIIENPDAVILLSRLAQQPNAHLLVRDYLTAQDADRPYHARFALALLQQDLSDTELKTARQRLSAAREADLSIVIEGAADPVRALQDLAEQANGKNILSKTRSKEDWYVRMMTGLERNSVTPEDRDVVSMAHTLLPETAHPAMRAAWRASPETLVAFARHAAKHRDRPAYLTLLRSPDLLPHYFRTLTPGADQRVGDLDDLLAEDVTNPHRSLHEFFLPPVSAAVTAAVRPAPTIEEQAALPYDRVVLVGGIASTSDAEKLAAMLGVPVELTANYRDKHRDYVMKDFAGIGSGDLVVINKTIASHQNVSLVTARCKEAGVPYVECPHTNLVRIADYIRDPKRLKRAQ